MILISKYLVPKGYIGITLFPFVVLKSSVLKFNKTLLNHEKIHLRQQLELLVIPFYLFYAIEFIVRLFQFKNWHKAYKNISFEKEAYKNENDLNYLKSRPFLAFFIYL
ncbi:hypothetical protein [Ichthyenterobacterium magnum]|uniref:Uncharacterized protein n=1 Tax=Ichthyenterobacterium magnum TaxID=1230530 RepID=A0A420DFJ2_9FLAO|nr:hypothetical protein [Ichthyenterobacterium magnum]RKE91990.1 hypothetical protein BXY80_2422 [Ichthyenterobacterium magnum]